MSDVRGLRMSCDMAVMRSLLACQAVCSLRVRSKIMSRMVLTLAARRASSSVPTTGMVWLSAPAAPTASDRRVTRRVSRRVKPMAIHE